ncbi:hypothetical protein GCM10008955_08860 [Deinococcus malanensis]|uniref:Uncharacterized protein n=2 Tax=Deinococcus malanensis TaxID=1706855 RepID=A0ABQ2EQW8_9DEIO|nr:hypothetical protein GCM10008955_08860 [Deinococcus malanensis]
MPRSIRPEAGFQPAVRRFAKDPPLSAQAGYRAAACTAAVTDCLFAGQGLPADATQPGDPIAGVSLARVLADKTG